MTCTTEKVSYRNYQKLKNKGDTGQKILLLRSTFNFKVRQILHITFSTGINERCKKGHVQK